MVLLSTSSKQDNWLDVMSCHDTRVLYSTDIIAGKYIIRAVLTCLSTRQTLVVGRVGRGEAGG